MHKTRESIDECNSIKLRPILFSTPMVRAILEGRKTMTRRIIKPQPDGEILGELYYVPNKESRRKVRHEFIDCENPLIGCPHGTPGDLLWVRETWAYNCLGLAIYKANFTELELNLASKGVFSWKPGIHLKKNDARIFLVIKKVKAERLSSITHRDSAKEGFHNIGDFIVGWNKINGPESWASDPWVWVIEYERMAK